MSNPQTTDPPDCMDSIWCCMTCSTTFRFGALRVRGADEDHPNGLGCPNCLDGKGLHPAGGEEVTLGEYRGDRGTVQ